MEFFLVVKNSRLVMGTIIFLTLGMILSDVLLFIVYHSCTITNVLDL